MRFPIYIFVGDWGSSGVVSWAYKMRHIYANDKSFEVRIVCFSKELPKQIKFDDHVYKLENLERIIAKNTTSFVIPNGIWETIPVVLRMIKSGFPIKPIGFCRAFSDADYFDPLIELESFFPVIVSVSPECTDELSKRLIYRRDRELYTRPTGVLRPRKNPFKIPADRFHFVYTGRYHQQQKRILDFIPLVNSLDCSDIDYQFHFYGSGSDQSLLEEGLSEQIESGKVIVHQRLHPDEIHEAYEHKHFFVQLSEYEGTSNSMLEAMSYGLIPLVTDTGSGVNGIIKNGYNGFLFKIGFPESIAEVVRNLEGRPKSLMKISARAYRIAKNFDMKKYRRDFNKILKKYLRRKSMEIGSLRDFSHSPCEFVEPNIFKE